MPSQSEAGIDGNHGETIFDSSLTTGSSDPRAESCTASGGYLAGGNTEGGGIGKEFS